MKDNLEQFILEHKEQLDHKNPPIGMWDRISKGIRGSSSPEQRPWQGIFWKAAAIIFFGLSAFLLWDRVQDKVPNKELMAANQEFADIEDYYFTQINMKIESIRSMRSESVKPAEDFGENLGKLDAMYKVLKDEYEEDPSQEVIDALILNLIMRIDLINQQLNNLQQVEQEEVIEQST